MDHRKHATRSRERMKGYAMGGAVEADDQGEADGRHADRKEKLSEVMNLKSNPKENQQ